MTELQMAMADLLASTPADLKQEIHSLKQENAALRLQLQDLQGKHAQLHEDVLRLQTQVILKCQNRERAGEGREKEGVCVCVTEALTERERDRQTHAHAQR